MNWQPPKGTFDILPYGAKEEWQLSCAWQSIERILRQVAATYGYQEIRTPIYEATELFSRSVGDTSDIVMKEMFTFEDRGQRSLSLRPEGTAAVMRALLSHQLFNLSKVHKLFYIAPMFRYERPQSGRYRQHHQFGVEAIGVGSALQDAEIIDLFYTTCRELGLKNVQVQINSIGDKESRTEFKEALLRYLNPIVNELSVDSQTRFQRNPLRILDSKDPKDQEILKNAPSIHQYFTPQARTHFDELRRLLDAIHVPYVWNEKIVRGLDYYQNTVFEVTTQALGSQNAVGGGGRYDDLIGSLGGPDLPAVGFGMGIERVLQLLLVQGTQIQIPAPIYCYFIPLEPQAKQLCFEWVTECRRRGIPAEMSEESKKLQQSLQRAIHRGAKQCILVGSAELEQSIAQIKDLSKRTQQQVPFDTVISACETLWNQEKAP